MVGIIYSFVYGPKKPKDDMDLKHQRPRRRTMVGGENWDQDRMYYPLQENLVQ